MNILALPAPGDPLQRYLAHREAMLQNPHLVVRTRPLPAAWLQAVFEEAAAKEAKAWRKKRNTQLRRIRRLAKRIQAKWPPLAGAKADLRETIIWRKDDRWVAFKGMRVLMKLYNKKVCIGYHDGEDWCREGGGPVDWPVKAWAYLPYGPF